MAQFHINILGSIANIELEDDETVVGIEIKPDASGCSVEAFLSTDTVASVPIRLTIDQIRQLMAQQPRSST